MMKYDYKTIKVPTNRKSRFASITIDTEELNRVLMRLGGEGWEVVTKIENLIGGSLIEAVLILKRERLR